MAGLSHRCSNISAHMSSNNVSKNTVCRTHNHPAEEYIRMDLSHLESQIILAEFIYKLSVEEYLQKADLSHLKSLISLGEFTPIQTVNFFLSM